MATDHIINLNDMREQVAHAEELVSQLHAYAKRIGCQVFHDEIHCHTDEQSERVAAWWMQNVGGS